MNPVTRPPDASPPAPSRYDSLDAWRGIACLMVVVLHAGHYAKERLDPLAQSLDPVGSAVLSVVGRLGAGVQLFFVISGYCIAATVVSTCRKGTPAGQFFARRFRRIFPPYWAALLVMAAVVALASALGIAGPLTSPEGRGFALVPSPDELSISQWVGNLTLTEHWRWHLAGGPELKLHGPAWTLCYEEQFYAVCGLLLVVTRRWFFFGVGVVTAGTAALVLGAHLAGGRVPGGFFFDGRWLLFAAGVFVYRHIATPGGGRRWLTPTVLATAMVGSLGFRFARLGAGADPVLRQLAYEWVIGAAFAMLLLAVHRWDRWLTRARALGPVFWCGRMCYSLYLIHWPVTLVVGVWLYHIGIRGLWPTILITIPVATVLSVLASWVFFVLVERRFWNPPHQTADSSAPAPCGTTTDFVPAPIPGRLQPSPA